MPSSSGRTWSVSISNPSATAAAVGQDTFAFGIGTGYDVLTDFNPNVDTLDLIAYGFDSFVDDVLANATNVRGSMLIDFSPAGMISVTGMSVDDFNADHVLL